MNNLKYISIGVLVLMGALFYFIHQSNKMSAERLKQAEIAAMHKEYGIFLTPTRMDAQGVSRDEAMASGLVPVTNAVTAIPEFVDESCGVLAPDNDYVIMAKGISDIYRNERIFFRKSIAAKIKVESISAKKVILKKELVLIKGFENEKY